MNRHTHKRAPAATILTQFYLPSDSKRPSQFPNLGHASRITSNSVSIATIEP